MKAFGKPDVILQNGLKLAGQKYLPVRYDDRSIYAKKVLLCALCPGRPERVQSAKGGRADGIKGPWRRCSRCRAPAVLAASRQSRPS